MLDDRGAVPRWLWAPLVVLLAVVTIANQAVDAVAGSSDDQNSRAILFLQVIGAVVAVIGVVSLIYVFTRTQSQAPSAPNRSLAFGTVFWVLAAVLIMATSTYSSEFFYAGLFSYRLPILDIRISLVAAAFMAFLKFAAGSMYSRVRSSETGALRALLLAYLVAMTLALVLVDFISFTMLSFSIFWPWPDEYAASLPYWINGWLGLLGGALALATVMLGYVTGAMTRNERSAESQTQGNEAKSRGWIFGGVLAAPVLLLLGAAGLHFIGGSIAPPTQREATYIVFVDATATWNSPRDRTRNEHVLSSASNALVQSIEDSSLQQARIRYYFIDDRPEQPPFCATDFRPSLLGTASLPAGQISDLRTLRQYLAELCVSSAMAAPPSSGADFRASVTLGVRQSSSEQGRRVLIILSDLKDETPARAPIDVAGYEVFLFYRALPGDTSDDVDARVSSMRERLVQGGANAVTAAPDTAITRDALGQVL